MLLKKALKNIKMIVIKDLRDQMPLRKILRISGISPPEYYYMLIKRHILKFDLSV